ncbi:unnamed protein product [Symbiodinium sp. CCMP2592]|nr:unnamed protein product [Symbiodinium sp. CCMP2592]
MASADVVVLSVKVAKQRKPRAPQLRKADKLAGTFRGQDQDMQQELQVKDEVKEEVEDMKKEVTEEGSTNRRQKVKSEIKEESPKDMMEQKAEEEITQKDIKQEVKQEVKEEVSKDAPMEVKKEDSEVKVGIKHEVKQQDQEWPSQLPDMKLERVDDQTGIKQEEVDEVHVKQENFEQPGPKRRRLSQKSPDISVPSFKSRVTEWAEKCLAFQSSGKTWLPTKPCCPASPFLGLAAAPWQGCVRDTTTACVQLLGKEQFRELRDFYRENPHHALFHDNSDPSSEGHAVTTAGSRPQPHRSSTGNQHRAAECMKMWPWMRDLPTRAWAGNGWLLVEDGMMKLSPTGGGSAMQGLEIFESVGSVPELGEQKPLESTSQVEPRAEGEQVVTRSFRGLERQSGVQNIHWDRPMALWILSWREAGKRKRLAFSVSKHMKLGFSEAEASETALEEAKAFRDELVTLGKLKPPTPITQKASGSLLRGIKYDKRRGTYQVRIADPSTNKRVHGGMFKVKAEAEARARELAKELGLQEEVVPVKPLSELPNFEPLGPQKGIRWVPGEQAWHARCQGKHMRFRPKDFSPKEAEKAWKQAVAWRKQQEKDRAEQPRKRRRGRE